MDLKRPPQPFKIQRRVLNVPRNSNITKAKKVTKPTQRKAEALPTVSIKFCLDVLNVQEILFYVTQPCTTWTKMKRDILDGYHGAPRITISELEMLDTLQSQISRGRGTANIFSFDQLEDSEFKQASLVLHNLIEGQDAIIPGTNFTYRFAKSLIDELDKSEYLKWIRKEIVTRQEKQQETTLASPGADLNSNLEILNPYFD